MGRDHYNNSIMNSSKDKFINTDPILFVTKRPEVGMQKGEGVYLWDTTGKYLDFIGGWGNLFGVLPEVMVETLSQQSKTLINASPQFYNDQMLAYADLLVQHTCMDKVFFVQLVLCE